MFIKKNFGDQLGLKGFWEKSAPNFIKNDRYFGQIVEFFAQNFDPFFQKMTKFGQKTTFVEKKFLTIFWEISSRETPESLNMIPPIPRKLWALPVFGRQVVTASYLAPLGNLKNTNTAFKKSRQSSVCAIVRMILI